MTHRRAAVLVNLVVAVGLVVPAGTASAGYVAPTRLFQPATTTDAGTDGPFAFAVPPVNLDGEGGLDLVTVGCPVQQAPACDDPASSTLAVTFGDGRGNFRVGFKAHAGSYPTGAAVGDFNRIADVGGPARDGRIDLAITDPTAPGSTEPGKVYIYTQTASRSFTRTATYTLAQAQPRGIVSADVNRDGLADLVVAMGHGSATTGAVNIQVLLGQANGSFVPQPAFGTCKTAHFFEGAADFDGNGALDFVVSCAGDNKAAVFLNNGSGTAFTQVDFPGIPRAHDTWVADFNRDNKADFLVASDAGLYVQLGNGVGGFAPAPGSPYSQGYPAGTSLQTFFLAVADFGRPGGIEPDGVLDAAVVNPSVKFQSASVSVLMGKGDGSLESATSLGLPLDFGAKTSFVTWGVAAGDWNSDGKVDLAVAGGVPANVPGKLTLLFHASDRRYWLAASDGGVFALGDARFLGSTGNITLNRPVVGMAATPSSNGYWLVASDGGIFAFGDARFFGSTGALALNRPVVGMAPTPSGRGYWLVASDGGVFAFGDAQFYGSTGALALNRPIVGIAASPSGKGYTLVASDGGIFAFGDAGFYGSTGATVLNKPVVGMAATPTGKGYWMVASDGGIFAFGDSRFLGSTGASLLNRPIVGMTTTTSGDGYWLVASDGGIFAFGGAVFAGSTGAIRLNKPIVGMAAV